MQIRLSFASESHVPRFRAGVGTWRSGYMIPIRLPWRHRARPSATLHEIPSLPRKANFSIMLQRRMGFVNSFVDATAKGLKSLCLAVPISTLFVREVSMEKWRNNVFVCLSGSWKSIWSCRSKSYLFVLLISFFLVLTSLPERSAGQSASPTSASDLSETPAKFTPVTDAFDYVKRDVMIPMRDGVKLHTVIVLPKGARNAPILLTRTPYNATTQTSHANSAHLGPILNGYDNPTEVIVEGGYIRVVQDVRGKYGSEGDYVMTRPLHGPLNPTPVDHATDTYDTIDWLVKNIPESNGKVGVLGISYDGFTTLMALVNPHPALKVAVPMNPMVDGWMGDDWFHNGAFREQNMPYIYEQDGTRDNSAKWWTAHFDDYDVFMEAGSAGELGRRHGLEQ
ncbi:MAG: cocE 3, partial [Candidatus Sulfotelmatobacter sp.]|nr:cocE 3 [Candidatus Sulfotelmatobacter sp.]